MISKTIVVPIACLSTALAGCSAPQHQDRASLSMTPSRASEPTVLARCPATFEEARHEARCAFGLTECKYAEGACRCPPPPQCGGAQLPPPAPGATAPFECVPTDPGVTKADGCPYQPPADLSGCFSNGLSCSYGECSWAQTIATCTRNQWRVEQRMSSPPP